MFGCICTENPIWFSRWNTTQICVGRQTCFQSITSVLKSEVFNWPQQQESVYKKDFDTLLCQWTIQMCEIQGIAVWCVTPLLDLFFYS